MEGLKTNLQKAGKYFFVFARWVVVGLLVGTIIGLCGTAFAYAITFATQLRSSYSWILFLLPVLGLIIVWIYNRAGMGNQPGTNLILLSVRTEESVPLVMTPVIFAATLLTHLGGGSAGREGAALQIGGSIAQQIGRWMKADKQSMHIFSMCGMSACFACLFGTPVAATVFAMEVVSVGIMHYSALIPCAVSALTADYIARCFHVHHMHFTVETLSEGFDLIMGGKVCILAVGIAVVSILFCKVLHTGAELYERYLKNQYLRIVVGGLLIVVLTLLLGTRDYLGAGEDIIVAAINGEARPEAFLLKMIFTALALEAGYKGGEIVPTLFIGSTFGCVVGGWLGLSPSFGAAVGMIALFCGMTNCPLASIFLGLELFGGAGIEWLLLAVAVSYILSGYYGLYSQQKIIYSKYRPEYIDAKAH